MRANDPVVLAFNDKLHQCFFITPGKRVFHRPECRFENIELAIFFCGLFFTKAIITPFAPWLKVVFDERGEHVEVVGKTCTIASLEVTPKYGQAEYSKDSISLLLNVRTKPGVTLTKGDEAVIFDHDEEKDVYLVAKFNINTPMDQEI